MQKSCQACDETPSYYSKKCVECGRQYLRLAEESEVTDAVASEDSALVYKLVRLVGGGLCFGAIGAAILDYPTVASGVLGLGIAIFVSGIAGAWWNKP